MIFHLLIVDDEAIFRKGLSQYINWETYDCVVSATAKNGTEAIDIIESTPIDIVITDVRMPSLDGIGLAKYIHENHPEISVIILSGYSEFEYGDLELEKTQEGFKATVEIKNIGEYDGTETVQLYIHRRKATRVRPVRELKGYKKVTLKSGESRKVSLCVNREDLGYYDTRMNYIVDESEFDVWMAHDSGCGSWARISL